jgi:hypothetical protein
MTSLPVSLLLLAATPIAASVPPAGDSTKCRAPNLCRCTEDTDCPTAMACNSFGPGSAGVLNPLFDFKGQFQPGYCRPVDPYGQRTEDPQDDATTAELAALIARRRKGCELAKGDAEERCRNEKLIAVHTAICRSRLKLPPGAPSTWTEEMQAQFMKCLTRFGPYYWMVRRWGAAIPDSWGTAPAAVRPPLLWKQ